MPILLKIDSSPMGERSISRKLSAAFAKRGVMLIREEPLCP